MVISMYLFYFFLTGNNVFNVYIKKDTELIKANLIGSPYN